MADQHPGVLDLSQVEAAPIKVKLPDGELYDMASPGSFGMLPLQRMVARHRRAQELMSGMDNDGAEEMSELLIDVACDILPGASRDVVGQLGMPHIERLIQAFFDASPAKSQAAAEGAAKASQS